MTNQEREPLLSRKRTTVDNDNQQRQHASSANSQHFAPLEHRLQHGRFTSIERFMFTISITLFLLLTVFIGLYARRVYDGHDGIPPLPNPPSYDNETTPLCLTPGCVLTAAEVLQDIDLSVDPCEDFHAFSCNNWEKHHTLPEGKFSTSASSSLATANKLVLREVLSHDFDSFYQQLTDDETKNALPDPEKLVDKQNFEMVKAMYDSCMDEQTIDAKAAHPLLPLLHDIHDLYPGDGNEYDFSKNLTRAMASLLKNGVQPMFDLLVTSDPGHPENNMLQVIQSGLTLPSQEYYKKDDITKAMFETVAETMYLVYSAAQDDSDFGGWNKQQANDAANMVVDFEKRLAAISDDDEDLMDPTVTYNPLTLSELTKISPMVDWDLLISYLQPPSSPHQDALIITSPTYLARLHTELLRSSTPQSIFTYLTWRIISSYVDALGEGIRKPSQQLMAKIQGINAKVTLPRWELCLQQVDTSLGLLASRLFVQHQFESKAKEHVDDLIVSIKQALVDRFYTLDWLDQATRTKAIEKADKLISKVGYPTKSPNILSPVSLSEFYSGLHILDDDYFGNYLASRQFNAKKKWQKIGTVTDKNQWLMNPQEVNAYYNPTINEVVFPAGILQNPFFSTVYPEYLNYGGIGVVIGHELTHGFDSTGRHYDGNGQLVEWWTNATSAAFDEKAACFVNQYSNFTVDTGPGEKLHVKGKRTLGENLADNSGLNKAYLAWKQRYDSDRQGKKYNNDRLPGLDILTPNKLFFINFGRVWCSKMTEGHAKQKALTDEHSPPKWRINGAIQNSQHFAEAFGCRAGTQMNPVSKCSLW